MSGYFFLLMAGKSERFLKDYPNIPKPLLNIHNKHMFEIAAKSVFNNFNQVKNIFLCVNKRIYNKLDIKNNKYKILNINKSNSPIQTALKSLKKSRINLNKPIVFFDSDQIFELFNKINLQKYFNQNNVESFIFYKNTKDSNYGKIKTNNNIIKKAYHKNSNLTKGIVGVYDFSNANLFIKSAKAFSKKL